ncbi:hypothetical protein [Roseiconus lacunae]|uniref:hypothetical protein n=1 Tax=Roseiconus lacunae TaxID=2605694 RepID=UPI001E2A014F|nr:hypothetical protein [Roseiconus lacunae]MCD0460639.1 hypothetical protein [Roseiconus lacunae]
MINSSHSYVDIAVTHTAAAQAGAVKTGWLITRRRCPTGTDGQAGKTSAPTAPPDDRIFLQIANGQWGPTSAATWFPTESSARVYLEDFQPRYSETLELTHLSENTPPPAFSWNRLPTTPRACRWQ